MPRSFAITTYCIRTLLSNRSGLPMLRRASPRAQLVFHAQVLPTLAIVFVVAVSVTLVMVPKIPFTWALGYISAMLAVLLGVATATHSKSEARIKRLLVELCETGDWDDLGTAISVLAGRRGGDMSLVRLLFQGLQRPPLPPKLSLLPRRQLAWLALAVHGLDDAVFRAGIEAIVRLEPHLPPSILVRRDLKALATHDSRIEEHLVNSTL